jgi:hypothetical protein
MFMVTRVIGSVNNSYQERRFLCQLKQAVSAPKN